MGDVNGKFSGGIISIERSGKEVVALDREGRVIYYTDGNATWKRSLSNIYLKIGWEGEKRIIDRLDPKASEEINRKAYDFLSELSNEIDDETLKTAVDEVLSKPREWPASDAREFSRIYGERFPLIPQDQRLTAYFQLTDAFVWNCATFAAPRDEPKMRETSEFQEHVDEVKEHFGKGFELRRSTLVGDAYFLSAEQKAVLTALDAVREKTALPVYAFVDAFTVPRKKNMIHYQDMKRHGLSRVYIGIQSGSVSLLREFEKLKNVSEIINLANNLKNSGISVGLLLLTGYGGKKHSSEHVNETASIISQMDLDENDIIYISPMDEDDDPRYVALLDSGTFDRMSYDEKQSQAEELEARIREEFRGSNRIDLKTQISKYDLREGIY